MIDPHEGERLRDEGLAKAIRNRTTKILQCQVNLVRTILATGPRTIESIASPDEIMEGFADGGRWRGQICRGLVKLGIIVLDGFERSIRPSTRASDRKRWRIPDVPKAKRFVELSQLALDARKKDPPSPSDEGGPSDQV